MTVLRPLLMAMVAKVEEEPEPDPQDLPGVDTMYALATGRKTYRQEDLDTYERMGEKFRPSPKAEVDGQFGANLISSELPDGTHKPVIDCDYPIVLMQSSTQNHCHLYIEQELTWDQYKALLDGFYAAGLIQKLWYENAVKDKRSYVRLPHIKKPKR